MPVTAKLSSKFYQRLGDEVANELVGLLNAMDSTYLSELRQLNEFNFARFDAKVEQRTAELRADTTSGLAGLRAEMTAGFAEVRGEMAAGFAEVRSEMAAGFAEVRGEMRAGFAQLRTEQAQMRADLIRWTVGLAVPTLLGVLGTMISLIRLG